MKETENKDWMIKDGKAIMDIGTIKTGETKEYVVTLTWKKGEDNLGQEVNKVKLTEIENDAKYEDSDLSNNESKAEVILTISTGTEETIIVGGLIGLVVLSGIIIFIKKKM